MNTTQAALSIAKTISNQIGGRAFMMMGTDAYFVLAVERGLQFPIKGSRVANKVRVILEHDDTYTIEFFKVGRAKSRMVASVDNVYADSLKRVIESKTGLYLSL